MRQKIRNFQKLRQKFWKLEIHFPRYFPGNFSGNVKKKNWRKISKFEILHQKIRNFQKLRQKYWIFLKFWKKFLNLRQTIEFLDLKTQIVEKNKTFVSKIFIFEKFATNCQIWNYHKKKITFKFQKMCVELKMWIEKHFWGCRK